MLAYKKLKKIFYEHSLINDIDSLLQWDLSTYMPENSRNQRAKQLCFLNNLKIDLFSSSSVKKLFHDVEEKLLSSDDKANFKEMKKEFTYFTVLPQKIIEKKTLLSSSCEGLWRKAKQKNDFGIVKNEFSRLVSIVREEGKILSESLSCSPYDALIKNFENSYSSSEISRLFNNLLPFINKTYQQIIKKQKKQKIIPILKNLSKDQQLHIAKIFMKKIGFNFKKGRIDLSLHPFCGGGTDDIRITTRINEYDSFSAFEAVMHETGHALYEQGLPIKLKNQPAGKSGGMALHESQSLFIEMHIMKSKAFLNYFSKIIKKEFKLCGHEWSAENLFLIFNKVNKGFIRVESDEVTYPLHVILRFNVEKKSSKKILMLKKCQKYGMKNSKKYLNLRLKMILMVVSKIFIGTRVYLVIFQRIH